MEKGNYTWDYNWEALKRKFEMDEAEEEFEKAAEALRLAKEKLEEALFDSKAR